MKIKIALAQINCTVGDLTGNTQRILQAAQHAAFEGAHLVITPELALTGYPPEDLLLRPAFYEESWQSLQQLAKQLADCAAYVIVGLPIHSKTANGWLRYNAACILYQGKIIGQYFKQALPNDTVFDEKRYFTSGTQATVFTVQGVKIGINICEDAWFVNAPAAAKMAGAQLLLVLNASPYHMHKAQQRMQVMRERVSEIGLPLVYVNLVGGQDELVFDGSSFALNAQGKVVTQLPHCEEALGWVEYSNNTLQTNSNVQEEKIEEQVYKALILGVRDYLGKNNFPGAIIGLSGGIDSALTLALAVDALGKDKVRAVMMPSRYTAEMSLVDAKKMAQTLGVLYDEIPIEPMFEAFLNSLQSQFAGLSVDATEENIQARIRGTLLMALSNKTGWIVLTTGNKSEMATGYCTLYGDMAGGFAVIKDIFKTFVYRLCLYRNNKDAAPIIPKRMIIRPPSAELRADQKDQDSLPPYEILDEIVQRYMEEDRSVSEIIADGFPEADVKRVVHLIKINEYKRRQAPIGIRVTPRAFGRDWRYPITSKFLSS